MTLSGADVAQITLAVGVFRREMGGAVGLESVLMPARPLV
jgi:hypothetical protein